ncbi:MAG: DUF4333 domain-containing protein [Candidatus Nanopelagicales bacterium]
MRRTVVTMSLVAGLAAPAVLVTPAQAATSFPRKAVQQAIANQIREVVGQKATVKCPARKNWVKGKVMYCTAKPTNGAASYRVKVTLGNPNTYTFKWLKLG